MKFYGKRRNYRKKSTKKTYKKRGGVSLATKRYIKRTLHSQIENKIENITDSGVIVSSYSVNNNLTTIQCIPYNNINLGTGAGSRIGNEIKVRNITMSYVLRAAGYDLIFNPVPKPMEVLVFFGKLKVSKPVAPLAADFALLWQDGDNARAPYSTIQDVIQSVNKDVFTIYKVFKHKIGNSINTNSGANVAAASYANNDYKLNVVKKINCTKFAPKTLKFNDNTNRPTNDGLYMWCMAVNFDGTATTQSRPVYLDYNLVMTYEDA